MCIGIKHIKGSFEIGSQYPFTMEPQTTICVPDEQGINVHSATTWIDLTHIAWIFHRTVLICQYVI